ncbi:unnamed protein product [Caenorhabditis bovis]|uniref:G-protein coupled receptors family 1 profile domain-containing protein n=1 Tax=Caenorhabditis bovis TaxID=2654633 RepID=A0A8S1EJ57_9PELO|nr:unnamed protein product [Caenorhabditis bovis]
MTTMVLEENSTDYQCEYPPLDISFSLKILITTAYGVVGAMSLIGNLAVLIIVMCRKEMQTVTNIFISSVSAADLVITGFSLWATPLAYYQRVWYFGRAMCYMVSIVQGLSLMWVPLTLAAVALDRYTLVASPFQQPMSIRTCLTIIVGIWLGAFAVLTPMLTTIDFVDGYGPCHFCVENWGDMQQYRLFYGLSILFIRSALPLVLISLCHWRIAAILNSQTRKFKAMRNASTTSQSTDIRRKQRLQTLLLAMVVIFAASSLPLDLSNVLQDLTVVYHIRAVNEEVRHFIFYFSHWTAMAGTLLNPLVYAWWNENFRRQIKACVDEMRGQGKFKGGLYSIVSGRGDEENQNATQSHRRQTTRVEIGPRSRLQIEEDIQQTDL